MSLLRLYLTENWPSEPACEWVQIGPDGRVAAEGRSEPRHWPAAERTEVVLAGSQCVMLTARLPKAARREQDKLLRFAFEDQLIQDPESQHLVIADEEGDQVRALVVGRDRLRQIIAQLEALGRKPARVYAAIEACRPGNEAGWTLLRGAEQALLHGANALPFAFDAQGADVPELLLASAAQAREASRLPSRLLLRSAPGLASVDCRAWSEKLGLPVEAGEPWSWHAFSSACNLLQGEFRPAGDRAAWLRPARPALALLVGVLALELVVSLGQVLWQRQQLADARHTMQTVFKSAFPNQPLVDPVAQMRTGINAERRGHGQLGDDDLLPLLAATGEALGADARDAVAQMKFEGGKLELKLSPRLAAAPDAVVARLEARGLQVSRNADTLTLRKELVR
ncbi:type II secretion system protein GspL [Niveibacterium terrae]|uniref:type II secretion system protein GspL n=1 Tax=Niveibacterium terrae TaxID=3373598 RepID=UPI003A8F9335